MGLRMAGQKGFVAPSIPTRRLSLFRCLPHLGWFLWTQLKHPSVEAYDFIQDAPMPHYEFFCRACKKTFSRMLALVIGQKERSHARTVAAVTSSKCGLPFRFLRRRTARGVDSAAVRARLR
jgi:hypothetical protein